MQLLIPPRSTLGVLWTCSNTGSGTSTARTFKKSRTSTLRNWILSCPSFGWLCAGAQAILTSQSLSDCSARDWSATLRNADTHSRSSTPPSSREVVKRFWTGYPLALLTKMWTRALHHRHRSKRDPFVSHGYDPLATRPIRAYPCLYNELDHRWLPSALSLTACNRHYFWSDWNNLWGVLNV